ncbi:MAG: sigma-54 dependent transcriptional regulator [Candidimonas sp.]
MPHVLIVDDDHAICEVVAEVAADHGFTASRAPSVKDALIQFERKQPDLVLTDLSLPDSNGLEMLEKILPAGVEAAVMTGHASVETAVGALRLKVADYLSKPLCMDRLAALFRQAAESARARGRREKGGEALPNEAMLGQCAAMQEVREQIGRVAATDATVLLTGESGTGKELAARAIHTQGARASGPFLAVNCGAISPNLIESELFGHERGSFTGAQRQHKGYFESADGGTLFLDEITEMPMALQVRLLRVLESGCVMRVGTHREIECDVRIVAATNRDPEQAVQEKRLRQDLYYRLNVFPINLPPLRERREDITTLADDFLRRLNTRYGQNRYFSQAASAAVTRYDWPGNVRELRNFVRRAFILAEGDELDADTLLPYGDAGGWSGVHHIHVPLGVTLAEADRMMIMATLEKCGGVRKDTAQLLGISQKTLYNRLDAYAAVAATDDEALFSPDTRGRNLATSDRA